MIVVSCQHIKKFHGATVILEDVTCEIAQGERVGLIGRNGCGKSTLLQMIAGVQAIDEGQLSIQKRTRIGYLQQVPIDRVGETVYQVLALGYRELLDCRAQMVELEVEMTKRTEPELSKLLRHYSELQERFQRDGGYEMDAHINQVANGLRIPPEQFDRPYGTLSGGEQTKVGLASLLIERPTLLLLDEPTNHLDTAGIEWLEAFLVDYDGTCLVVSHDRYFLDRVVTKVLELEDGEALTYLTNYTGYVKEKEERLLLQFADFKDQQKRIKQMQATILQLQEWGKIGGNNKFFRRAASMQKALDRMERVKRPVLDRRTTEFNLAESDRSGKDVLKLASLSKRYSERPLLDQVDGALRFGDKVVLVGQNGAGKSTLFRLVLGRETPDSGAALLGTRVEVGYLAQQDYPTEAKTVLQHFCEQATLETGAGRARLARYLFYGEDVFKLVNQLSGGEWTRLRLALLMHHKPNLLLLDEPTNHLDIASREALEEALDEFPGTLLAISHDRYFVNRIAQRIWELEDGQLSVYLGTYDDYREKRAQRRLAQPIERPVIPVAKAVEKRDKARRPNDGDQRALAKLEERIKELEERLLTLELDLEKADSDSARVNSGWLEREQIQQELDQCYTEWVKLDSAPE